MLRQFIAYGLLGWCAEVVWTALYDLWTGTRRAEGDRIGRVPMTRAERLRLSGRTYLWMFPIYGSAAFVFNPAHDALRAQAWPLRGLVYMTGIFVVEAIAGLLLKAVTGRCPWDYSYARFNVAGVIRLDYAPVWFAFGLLLERVHDYLMQWPLS
ncbi:MAG TPA: hypothetical protein VFF06_31900 [Polyangia bacterium]|nr:hypothetical protein [Polyangia bacterium]